ncbi:hypothetical protein CGRA01v4_09723 [Colletotrichum graminicola]|nr:hypothetical protein CGRA01v4_09723 [Colletotrichum graminicola]
MPRCRCLQHTDIGPSPSFTIHLNNHPVTHLTVSTRISLLSINPTPLKQARHASFYFAFRHRPCLCGIRPGGCYLLLGLLLLHQHKRPWSLPAATLEGLLYLIVLRGINLPSSVHQPRRWLRLRLLRYCDRKMQEVLDGSKDDLVCLFNRAYLEMMGSGST